MLKDKWALVTGATAGLGLAVAFTGILALMPYIALQLVGIQSVLQVMGLGAGASAFEQDIPLIIAFVILAAFTYTSIWLQSVSVVVGASL